MTWREILVNPIQISDLKLGCSHVDDTENVGVAALEYIRAVEVGKGLCQNGVAFIVRFRDASN